MSGKHSVLIVSHLLSCSTENRKSDLFGVQIFESMTAFIIRKDLLKIAGLIA